MRKTREVKAKLYYLANNPVNTYKPWKNTLHKHKIIKKLRNNKDILIMKPIKGNGVIKVNRAIYIVQVYMKLLMIHQNVWNFLPALLLGEKGNFKDFCVLWTRKVFSVRRSMKTYILVIHDQLGCTAILRHTN